MQRLRMGVRRVAPGWGITMRYRLGSDDGQWCRHQTTRRRVNWGLEIVTYEFRV